MSMRENLLLFMHRPKRVYHKFQLVEINLNKGNTFYLEDFVFYCIEQLFGDLSGTYLYVKSVCPKFLLFYFKLQLN